MAALGCTALFTGVLMALGAAPASAAPSGCHMTSYGESVAVACSSGTGSVRVTTWCDGNIFEGNYFRVGPWVKVPQYSQVRCDSGDDAYDSGYQTK